MLNEFNKKKKRTIGLRAMPPRLVLPAVDASPELARGLQGPLLPPAVLAVHGRLDVNHLGPLHTYTNKMGKRGIFFMSKVILRSAWPSVAAMHACMHHGPARKRCQGKLASRSQAPLTSAGWPSSQSSPCSDP